MAKRVESSASLKSKLKIQVEYLVEPLPITLARARIAPRTPYISSITYAGTTIGPRNALDVNVNKNSPRSSFILSNEASTRLHSLPANFVMKSPVWRSRRLAPEPENAARGSQVVS